MATIKNTINSSSRISVDMFYDKQKELYDICGNVINNDMYPFVDILSKYLTDIVGLIDIEIKNSARNSMINWREKKNPKLLSRLINNDDNVNLINISMNKITSSNFMNIANEISEALLNDNYRKLPDYCSFLFDVVIKKCMIDEAFSKDYIRFLFGFKDNIAKHLNENVRKFTEEAVGFLTSNQPLKEYSYFHYVKDFTLWRNVGVIFANIYKSLSDNAGVGQININIIDNLESQFNILFNILDWLPSNIDELNGRLFMVFAIMESLIDEIWYKFSEKSRALFNEILTLVYNYANIPNKIKFKVLDLQDTIKNIKISPMVASTVTVQKTVVVDSIKSQNDNALGNNHMPIPNSNSNSNPVNIWETRKQQQVTTTPIHKQSISTTQPTPSTTSTTSTTSTVPLFTMLATNSSIPLSNVKELSNTNQRTSKNDNNKEDYIQLEAGSSRNRRSSHGKGVANYVRGSNRKVEEPKSKNMFSGLESGDSNDEHKTNDTNDADDDFITVEKKSKNIYKPKKTPAIAVEGGKIYANVSNASGKSNYSKRK